MAASSETTPIRIILWCVPRTVSTAFTKCVSGIDGMEIWFEPYTYCELVRNQYFKHVGEDIPMEYEGNEDTIKMAVELTHRLCFSRYKADRVTYSYVKRELELSTHQFVFVKDMGFAVSDEKTRRYIPKGFQHAFLIRDPGRALYSYRNLVYKQLSDGGFLRGDARDESKFDIEKGDMLFRPHQFFSDQYSLWNYIRTNVHPDPIVMDTDDLLRNPSEMVSKFCEKTSLPYSESLLRWNSSPDTIKTWKTTGDSLIADAPSCYDMAITSTGFYPPTNALPTHQFPEDVERLSRAALPLYNEMMQHKI